MPAVALLGPRQVGKTTLARQIAANWPSGALYLDMERPTDRRRLDDADAYLRQQRGKLVVIDEIHRAPGLFEILRGITGISPPTSSVFLHAEAGQSGPRHRASPKERHSDRDPEQYSQAGRMEIGGEICDSF